MRELDLALRLYVVVVLLDQFLALVQPDPSRPPRRWTHALTEPVQRPIRLLVRPEHLGGWDLSPLVLLVAVGLIRVLWLRPWER